MRPKTKHPTLSEVARKAGVGTTTVSRVINGGQSVDPATLARVQRAIEALGYLPNQAARILKGDRTRSIGFVIPSIADSFFSSCAEAAQAIARANDSLLIVLTTQNEPSAELEAVHVLLRHRVDGFVIAPSNSDHPGLRDLIRKLHMPVVSLDRPIIGVDTLSVLADNYDGARLATQHLLDHGYRRIACLTSETSLFTIQERLRAFRETMAAAGLEAVVDTTAHDALSTERALLTLLNGPHPPNALFTLKNSTTIEAFKVLQHHAIQVPKTVALLGYDDFQLAEMVRPSISVIQQPIDELGHLAAELLFQRLLGSQAKTAAGAPAAPQHVLLKTSLIRRASCGCHPGGNAAA